MENHRERLAAALGDRYRLERELGTGGMATVFLAYDLRHDRRVALKVMRPELAAIIGADRFLQEIRTTANLQHPHILALFDSGTVDGGVFYVMPFVEGESLRDRLTRERQLPVHEAVRLTKEVAAALDYAHRKGVIHRDIKPENILLHDGQAMVADFGIALAASAAQGSRLTQTGMSLGTPSYMSPEQATGERHLDARTDVYALGCVLYELLAGEPPFKGPTAQSIVAKVLSSQPERLSQLRSTVPAGLEAAVMRALQKLPADRFSSAAEFAAALDAPAGLSQPPGIPPAATSGFRWKHWAILAAGVAAGALGVRALGSKGEVGTGGLPRFLAIALPDSLPFTPAREVYGIAMGSLAISPDGRSVAYTSAYQGGSRLVLARLDQGTITPLQATEGSRTPVFSPDGAYLAFVQGDSLVQRLSVEDGRITGMIKGGPNSFVWHPDNRLYVDGGCQSVATTGGAAVALSSIACVSNWVTSEAALINPDAEWMLLQNQGRIQLVSRKSGAVRPLLVPASATDSAAPVYGHSPRFVPPGFLVFLRGNTLFAARFDANVLKLTGAPKAVLSGIQREQSGQAQMAVSGDGVFVWAGGGDGSLGRFVWVTPEGRIQDTVFLPPVEVGSYAVSPDGRRLAFSTVRADRTASLSIADLERRVVDRVSYPLRLEPTNWVRGGRALAALLIHGDGTGRGTVIDISRNPPTIDTSNALLQSDSPDGRVRCVEASNLFTAPSGSPISLAGEDLGPDSVAVTDAGGWCRFSPSGRLIVWGSPEGVFVRATTRESTSRVSVGPPGAAEPRWSSDGRQIRYREGSAWYSVPAPLADLKPAGPPRLLFRGTFLQALASWDQGPDGRFLLLQGEPSAGTDRLNVITNFPQFLARTLSQLH